MLIGELSRRTGVPVRTIRFYEQAGLLAAPARTPAGYRVYGEGAVARLRFVRSAQSLRLSLAEIASVLSIRDGGSLPCGYVSALLQTHIDAVSEKIAELTALRDELCARLPSDDPDEARCQADQVCYLIDDDTSVNPAG